MINRTIQKQTALTDNSRKSVLARGCDPAASAWATVNLPPLIGNLEYVATTNDNDFIEQLKSRKWSVVYFAPGACRFDAAHRPIPGNISQTQGWTLEDYRELVRKTQGEAIPIVESQEESQSLIRLREALENAREVG